METLVKQVNSELVRNPEIAMNVISPAELNAYVDTFGQKVGGKTVLGDTDLNLMYGHIVERLTAARVENDPCLSKYLEYIKTVNQTKGLPDFKGIGIDLEIDITTPEQAARKLAEGKNWTFIDYLRGLRMDVHGDAAPK
jgi:hypothetical protein